MEGQDQSAAVGKARDPVMEPDGLRAFLLVKLDAMKGLLDERDRRYGDQAAAHHAAVDNHAGKCLEKDEEWDIGP